MNDVFELRFDALEPTGRGYAFPCDPRGRVDLDKLDSMGRNNYLYAHALVGRDFAPPIVEREYI